MAQCHRRAETLLWLSVTEGLKHCYGSVSQVKFTPRSPVLICIKDNITDEHVTHNVLTLLCIPGALDHLELIHNYSIVKISFKFASSVLT